MALKPIPDSNEGIWYEKTPQPEDPNAVIWRYMDFTKFLSLLHTEQLYFCRLDRLGDPFEGSVPKRHAKAFEEMISDPKTAAQHRHVLHAHITSIFVSCWHLSKFENDALWKIYGTEGRSVAICSRYSKLRSLYGVKAGRVRYVDYNEEVLEQPVIEACAMLKRRSFEHEQEVRAIAKNLKMEKYKGDDGKSYVRFEPNAELGMKININVREFLDKVVVSPRAEKWFHELVSGVLEKYGLNIPVEMSELTDEPMFQGYGMPVRDEAPN